MRKTFTSTVFGYFLCISFLLMANGFDGMIAEANQNIPIGQMVSRGEVKFEIKENFWEKVENPFPIFEGMKIKTGKGKSVLAIAEKTRIEIGSDSLFYFDQRDQFNLLQGKINFRIQSTLPLRFKVGTVMGTVWIVRSYPFQTSKSSSVALSQNEDAMGSIFLHPKGSITVNSIRGALNIINQDHVVLASVSSGESITLPSTIASPHSPGMLAQSEPKWNEGPVEKEGFLGLSTDTWRWMGGGVGVVVIIKGVAVGVSRGGEDDEEVDPADPVYPVCP
jgi:hypothetical protein